MDSVIVSLSGISPIPAAGVDTSPFEAVARAVLVMYERISEPITVDDLARSALFSKFHFTRVFQRVTGMSPGRYLSAMRLAEAKKLLRSTDLKVIDITFAVGYSSVGTFSTRFASEVGLSPTEYRRRYREWAAGSRDCVDLRLEAGPGPAAA
jgi:transcriptional regulator GlxA family with amidase domain